MSVYAAKFVCLITILGSLAAPVAAQKNPDEARIKAEKIFEERLARAKNGDYRAQYDVAFEYRTTMGHLYDLKKAAYWFTKSARQGYEHSQEKLGFQYEKGVGVEQNTGKAIKWYTRAANQGNFRSAMALGAIFSTYGGASYDVALAEKWYRVAADLGFYNAIAKLELLPGVNLSAQELVQWYRLAASKMGRNEAIYDIGMAYAEGKGVNQNLVHAHMWFSLAADRGHTESRAKREGLVSLLSEQQIESSYKLGKQCEKTAFRDCEVQ